MDNKLEYKFAIKPIKKLTDDDYIKALHIYNDTTPYEIKTPSNEITFWLSKQNETTPFKINAFVLYLNDEVIGMSMTTYIKRTCVVIDEYLAVKEQYRIQTVFLGFESLIQGFYRETNIEVSFFLTEISHKGNGYEIDRESRISLKLLCVQEYGKVDALYFALPLGLNNHESSFRAFLYIKGIDAIKTINPSTYLEIVESIYYDYWKIWYSSIMTTAELEIYTEKMNKQYYEIKKSVNTTNSTIVVKHSKCSYLNEGTEFSKGTIPVKQKNKISLYWILFPIILVLPLLIIWGYSEALKLLNLSTTIESTVIGTIISSIITALTSLFIVRKKL